MTETQQRKRARRSALYSFVLHLALDNREVQKGRKKTFSLSDTGYERFGLAPQTAGLVLKTLAEIGVIGKGDKHPHLWHFSQELRDRLSKVQFEEKRLLAETLNEQLENDIVVRIKGTSLYAPQIAEALGLKAVYEDVER